MPPGDCSVCFNGRITLPPLHLLSLCRPDLLLSITLCANNDRRAVAGTVHPSRQPCRKKNIVSQQSVALSKHTERRCWRDNDRVKWPAGNLREKEKNWRHDCHFLFLKCTWGEMCECISSGWWRGIKKKNLTGPREGIEKLRIAGSQTRPLCESPFLPRLYSPEWKYENPISTLLQLTSVEAESK